MGETFEWKCAFVFLSVVIFRDKCPNPTSARELHSEIPDDRVINAARYNETAWRVLRNDYGEELRFLSIYQLATAKLIRDQRVHGASCFHVRHYHHVVPMHFPCHRGKFRLQSGTPARANDMRLSLFSGTVARLEPSERKSVAKFAQYFLRPGDKPRA